MRSISFKLVGAFILVILLGMISNSIIIPDLVSTFFNYYLIYTGNTMANSLVPQLQSYYQEHGNWEGVNEIFFNNPLFMAESGPNNGGPDNNGPINNAPDLNPNTTGPNNPGPANIGPNNPVHNIQNPEMGPWMAAPSRRIDIRFTLLDQNGDTVFDNVRDPNNNQIQQQRNPPEDQKKSYPIVVDNITVGTLIVYGDPKDPMSPGFSFIEATTRATWITTLITAILAVILGIIIFRQIVSPLRQMTKAAQLITQGDLSQRVVVTSKDEIGTLATTFNQMAETLEKNQQTRRNLTADIAHELRTPISIIQANLEAMLDGVLQTSPDEIASLRDESSLLARLVDDLRLLSLAEAGQLKLVFSNIQVKTLLQKALEPLYNQAEDQSIKISLIVDEGLPDIEVDTDRIAMVIRNLLNNAFRYTPRGGEVTISARLNLENNKQMVIEVTDTGIGINPLDLPYVFDRFYRADPSRSRSSGGTGIGLAIVKQLVESHGGNVFVESPIFKKSNVGYGTRFWFTLNYA